MRVLNLLTSGKIGGIESLCRDIGLYGQFDSAFCFLSDEGEIYEQMRGYGLKTYSLKSKKWKFSLNKFKRLLDIAEQYDIIVGHHADPFLKVYFWMLSKKLDKKFVTVVHSCYEEKYFYPQNFIKKKLAKKFFQGALDSSDKVIFVSEAGRRSYETEFRLQHEKCCVVYNGIGLDKVEMGRDTMKNSPEIYEISYIGRLHPAKGVDLLLQAVSMLTERYPLHLSIVGDGEIRMKLEQQVKDLGLETVVTFSGKQSDVIPYLQKTNVFVYPSVCQEVFGISVVEAMAFGAICIANNLGGLPEIIKDGVNGILTKEVSAKGIAEAIERAIVCHRDGSYEVISAEARKTAERFSIRNTAECLEEIYQTL